MSNPIPIKISFWKYLRKMKGRGFHVLFIVIGAIASIVWYCIDGSVDVLKATIVVLLLWVLVCFLMWRRYLKGKQY